MTNRVSRKWLVLFGVVPLTPCPLLSCTAEAHPQEERTQQGQSIADAARQSRWQ